MIIIHFKIIIIKININNDNNKLKSDQLLLLDCDIIIIVDIIDNIISDNYCCWIAISCYCYSKMVQTETKLAIRYYSTADDDNPFGCYWIAMCLAVNFFFLYLFFYIYRESIFEISKC